MNNRIIHFKLLRLPWHLTLSIFLLSTSLLANPDEPAVLESFDPICPDHVPRNLNGIQNGISGTWSGTNVTANQFDPDGLSGTIMLTFTPDADQCAGVATTTILVTDDIEPNLDDFGPMCETDGILFLPIIQSGISGMWSGEGVTANAFIPSGLSGLVDLTFTPFPGQCAIEAMTTITVESLPEEVLSSHQAQVCNDGGSSTLLDLASLIINNNVNGTWLDSDGTGVNFANTSAIDFSNIPAATYTFTYFTNTPNLACPEPSYEVEVLVENCGCPTIDLTSPAPLCNNDVPFDLTDLQSTMEVGTWSIISTTVVGNSATLTGSIFDAGGSDAGMYELSFSLDNPISGCPNSNTLSLEVHEELSAGMPLKPLVFCAEQDSVVILSEQIEGENIGGTWQETSVQASTGTAFDASNGTFSPLHQAGGVYTFAYTVGTVNSACPIDVRTVTITINESPLADAGPDQELTCHTAAVTLDGSSSVGDSYTWTNEVGQVIGTSPTVLVETASIYTLTVTSSDACQMTDQVQVHAAPQAIQATIATQTPDCINPTGDIILSQISGGSPPYVFSLNDGGFTSSSQFTNLEAGTYNMVIQDMEGCLWDTVIVLEEAIQPSLDLGDDVHLFIGETASLSIETNLSASEISSIDWSNDSIISCDNSCFNPSLSPTETTTLYATITAKNGCTASDELTVFVNRTPFIYAPTAFSPDGDDNNEFFMIYTGKGVKAFQSLQIFSRWGEMVYEATDLTLNKEEVGWDGLIKNKRAHSNIFIWVATFELTDGGVERMTGEVSVIK